MNGLGYASLSGEQLILGDRCQSPRSDGRAVGDAAGEAYEGAVTPEVLINGPGPRNWERRIWALQTLRKVQG